MIHAIGTAITPLVARPFVVGSWRRHESSADVQQVRAVYALVGAFDIVVAFTCLVTSSLFPVDVRPLESSRDWEPVTGNSATNRYRCDEHVKSVSQRRNAVSLLVASLFFVVNGGRDALLNTLLFTYIQEYLGWTVTPSTLLLTVYHVTRVVVHAILVPVSRVTSPARMMTFSTATLAVSSALMLAALVGGDALTVAGVIVTALATSNLHRTTINVASETIRINPSVMALFISAIGVGQIVTAPLSGQLLQTAGVSSFPMMLLTLALTELALFCFFVSVTARGVGADDITRRFSSNEI